MKNAIKSTTEKTELENQPTQELIKETVGVDDYDFALSIIASAGSAFEPFLGKEGGLKAIMQSLRDLKPRNSIELELSILN